MTKHRKRLLRIKGKVQELSPSELARCKQELERLKSTLYQDGYPIWLAIQLVRAEVMERKDHKNRFSRETVNGVMADPDGGF